MIGIDTNILVRYITRDDVKQARRAVKILEKTCTKDNPGYISSLVIGEVIWTLFSVFEYTREEVIETLDSLLNAEELKFEHEDSVWYAYEQFKAGFDFQDALIGHINNASGCTTTITFDKKAARMKEFTSA